MFWGLLSQVLFLKVEVSEVGLGPPGRSSRFQFLAMSGVGGCGEIILPALMWFPFHFLCVKGTLLGFRLFSEEIVAYEAVGSMCLQEEVSSGSFCVAMFNQYHLFLLIMLYKIKLIFADCKNKSLKMCIHVVLLIFDIGVYTRNRNFRLYKSSKIGKLVALEVAEDNKFSLKHLDISEENQYFLSSLVSNVR